MIGALLGAIQFLTVIPIRRSTTALGQSAVFFPIIGACLGVIGALLLDLASRLFPLSLAALLVIGSWILLTGGLHEDGFADVFDAFRRGRSAEKIHDILKDSRIGAHGALAVVFSVLIRWQSVSAIVVDTIPALAAAQALPRAALVALAWITRPVGSGLGAAFAQSLNTPVVIAVLVQGVALALLSGARLAPLLLGGTTLIVLIARRYFESRIGGVTGDCLGATGHVVEIYCLLVTACRSCIS